VVKEVSLGGGRGGKRGGEGTNRRSRRKKRMKSWRHGGVCGEATEAEGFLLFRK